MTRYGFNLEIKYQYIKRVYTALFAIETQRMRKYNSSTFFLAQGVLRRNLRLDEILGSILKQLMSMSIAISSQPMRVTKWVRIISSVLPCRGSLEGVLMNAAKIKTK